MASRRRRPVTRAAAEEAVRTLLRWTGDDPAREGLRDTPSRVVAAYEEWFSGYASDPADYLRRTFEEVGGYDEMVVLRDISFESHCEHHLAPIIGRVHVGYLPNNKVVGISKLARVVEGYSRRLQVQEKLTAQIAGCIDEVLHPRGVGVVVDAVHQCMTTRGVHKRGVSMITSRMTGTFREDARTRAEFLQFIGIHSRDNDLVVNPIKTKKLTNVRAAGKDDAILLTPPIPLTLEYAVEFIADDELVEVTPASIRIRKRFLKEADRKRSARAADAAAIPA